MYNYTLLCIIIHTAQHTYIGAPTVLARLITIITYPQQFVNRQIAQTFNPLISHYCLVLTNRKKIKKLLLNPLTRACLCGIITTERGREKPSTEREITTMKEFIHTQLTNGNEVFGIILSILYFIVPVVVFGLIAWGIIRGIEAIHDYRVVRELRRHPDLCEVAKRHWR